MAMSAKDAIKTFKVKLLQELPLDEPLFLAMVETAGLFPLNTRDCIRAEKTRAHKVDYFLDHVVEPGADDYLPKLLKVMRESGVPNVQRLAGDIQATLQSGIYTIICSSLCTYYVCRFVNNVATCTWIYIYMYKYQHAYICAVKDIFSVRLQH